MTTLELREGDIPRQVAIDDDALGHLVAEGIIVARRLGPDRWDISAAAKVGTVRINELVVRIAPKVDIARVFFLLGYAKKPGWRPGLVDFAPSPGLLATLARAFVDQAERAIDRGLLQGYVETEDALAVLRGRLREQEQLRRNYGLAIPLLVRYDEYTTDIAENRWLRSATDRLLRLPDVDEPTRRRLRSLRLALADVSSVAVGAPLPRWHEHRLNSRYHVALWLAELVLSDRAVEHRRGEVDMDGFLVDMAKVFEDFVTAALSRSLHALGGACRGQDRHHLDVLDEVTIRPDLVWYDGGPPVAVIDAKYKAEKPAGFPDADLYQLLAYTTALDLPVGHLVYAKGNEAARSYEIKNADKRIFAHALDLGVTDAELLAQVDEVAADIADHAGPKPR